MKCINFDRQFERYMTEWVSDNGEKYKNNMDVIEAMMPDVYMEFLAKPASWLDGASPSAYFGQFSDPQMLVEWMNTYIATGVPVPDLLLERIVDLGGASEDSLMAILEDEAAGEEAQMTAISLLREMQSVRPMKMYISYIASIKDADEKADMCAESLVSMGEDAVAAIVAALDTASDAAKDIFADILSNYPGEEKAFELLMDRFAIREEKRALFASYLAKFGDDRALPALYAAAQLNEISYLDYVEVVNAIDALGGDRPPEREFAGDPYYESLKRV